MLLNSYVVPPQAADHLKDLIELPDMLGGWAAAHYAPYATSDELQRWIKRLGTGELDFNYSNLSGAALGERLSGPILQEFIDTLASAESKDPMFFDQTERTQESAKRFAFEAVIRGLDEANIKVIISWALGKNHFIRGLVCGSIYNIPGDHIDHFLHRQLDRGVKEAIFGVYMRLKFGRSENIYPYVPSATRRRLHLLLSDAEQVQGDERSWGVPLIHECAVRDSKWASAIREASKDHPDVSVRRVLKLLDPRASKEEKKKFALLGLKSPSKLSSLERIVFAEIMEDEVMLPEERVLEAIRSHGRVVISLLEDVLRETRKSTIHVSASRADEWINVLADIFPGNWADDIALSLVASFLARALPDKGRERAISRANDCKDPASDFALGLIVGRMSGVTTDVLKQDRAQRLLDLYISGQLEFDPSPGKIATEKFVAEVVLPYVKALPLDSSAKDRIAQVFHDAGEVLDRRYADAWS